MYILTIKYKIVPEMAPSAMSTPAYIMKSKKIGSKTWSRLVFDENFMRAAHSYVTLFAVYL